MARYGRQNSYFCRNHGNVRLAKFALSCNHGIVLPAKFAFFHKEELPNNWDVLYDSVWEEYSNMNSMNYMWSFSKYCMSDSTCKQKQCVICLIPFHILGIMVLAIINGLITSVILETIILMKQNLNFSKAFKTAMGMSFISMISMEVAMNLTDYFLTGGAILTWWVIPIMLLVGFLTPWPYNYWRLKKFGIACH